MHIFTVSLFGHRIMKNPAAAEAALEDLVFSLLHEHEYVEFLLGRNGDFDLLAASVIRRCRRLAGEEGSRMVLVLPYETAEYRHDRDALLAYYDDVEICEASFPRGHGGAQPRYGGSFRSGCLLCGAGNRRRIPRHGVCAGQRDCMRESGSGSGADDAGMMDHFQPFFALKAAHESLNVV